MEVQKNKNIGNYYGATPDRPYHLSVGAIVLDKNNNILCLHYESIDELREIYKLPTGTVKPGETLEATLQREMLEELGAEVTLITFLGSIVVNDIWWKELGKPTKMEKSVMFFLTKALDWDVSKVEKSENTHREVVTKPFDFLIESMQKLQVKDGMRDFDQSKILIRAKEWIKTHPGLTSETL